MGSEQLSVIGVVGRYVKSHEPKGKGQKKRGKRKEKGNLKPASRSNLDHGKMAKTYGIVIVGF